MRIKLRPIAGRWHVLCPGCRHDAFHAPLPGSNLRNALADAYWRAEQMYNDHLYGFDVGARSCPVARLDLGGVDG